MTNFSCLTRIEFEDTIEGQVLHRGTLEECERVQENIPAVSISSGRRVLSSSLVIVEDRDGNLEPGARYQLEKKKQ